MEPDFGFNEIVATLVRIEIVRCVTLPLFASQWIQYFLKLLERSLILLIGRIDSKVITKEKLHLSRDH